MSWDLFVHDIPASAKSLAEIPQNFRPQPIGKRADIVARIREVVPNVDFSRPDWGVIDGPGNSIEVNIGVEEELRDFALHVRGGNEVVSVVAQILGHLGLRAFDPSSETGIFEPDTNGFQKWKAYRDQVIGEETS